MTTATKKPQTRRQRLCAVLQLGVWPQIAAQVLVADEAGIKRPLPAWVWEEHYRQRFIGGKSTKTLTDDQLHRYILAVESDSASRLKVTFVNRSEQT